MARLNSNIFKSGVKLEAKEINFSNAAIKKDMNELVAMQSTILTRKSVNIENLKQVVQL